MLTQRDIAIAEWFGRQGAVRAEHVMVRFSVGRTATYRRLHELVEFGLLRRRRVLYNDGGLLTATAEGLRCAGLDRLTPARITLAMVPHMIAIIGAHQDGHDALHRPDFALVKRDRGEVVAVEIELTLKNRTRLERILRGYLRNQNVSAVRYHAPRPIGEAVGRAARAVGANDILEVMPLPSAVATTHRSRS